MLEIFVSWEGCGERREGNRTESTVTKRSGVIEKHVVHSHRGIIKINYIEAFKKYAPLAQVS